jgi:hypothetical protein
MESNMAENPVCPEGQLFVQLRDADDGAYIENAKFSIWQESVPVPTYWSVAGNGNYCVRIVAGDRGLVEAADYDPASLSWNESGAVTRLMSKPPPEASVG